MALLAFFTGLLVRFGYVDAQAEILARPFARSFPFVIVLLAASYIFEVYNSGAHRSKREILGNILIAVSVSFIILSIIFFLNPDLKIGRGLLAISLAAFVLYQFIWHVLYVVGFNHPFLAERIIVLGTGSLAGQMGDLILASTSHFSHTLAGYVATGNQQESVSVPAEKIVGNAHELMAIAQREKASKIIVSLPVRGGVSSLRDVLLNCKFQGIDIVDTPSFYERVTGKLMLENMNISGLIYSTGFRRTALMSAVKRTIDIGSSLLGMLLSLPLFPVIALLVKLDSPGPVFFSQVRVGQWEKKFVLYKFRTMCQDAESKTGAIWAQEDDPRIGPVGRFLRKCRLDELPQLYNVLRGDMSFVGPRPERPEFVEKLDELIPFYPKRHFIKPGITGWAQVRYPYGASVEDAYEKLRYDLYYIKNMSPLLDAIIIFQTFKVVIFGRGGR